MKNIAFIINPISGTQNKRKLPKTIEQLLDKEQWLANIVFTERAGHATELARQYARMGFDAVVAVGGDGTVNEVASGLRDTETALGIIPMGSGNGFARHIGIPLRTQRAIEMLNRSEVIKADYGLAEDHVFVTTCGTGFDALIADRFAQAGTRGFQTYFKKVIQDALTYKSETYRITEGDKLLFEHKAFLLTFANANQWGNNARIAPHASLQDGKMDVMLLSRHALLDALPLAWRLFTGSIDRSPLVRTLRARQLTLHRQTDAAFHIDGNPVTMPADVTIRIMPHGFNVLVDNNTQAK